jgi:hypothetical protein
MTNENTYRIYTEADIRRYLNGEMSSKEMYALEKLAIEDPFLADAIEGYNAMSSDAAQADLQWLQQNLGQQQEAKVIPLQAASKKKFPWVKMGIAASFIGLVTFLGIKAFDSKKMNESDAYAKNEQAPVTAATTDSIVAFNEVKDSLNFKSNTATTATLKATSQSVFVRPEDLKAFYNKMDYAVTVPDVNATEAPPGAISTAPQKDMAMESKAEEKKLDTARLRVTEASKQAADQEQVIANATTPAPVTVTQSVPRADVGQNSDRVLNRNQNRAANNVDLNNQRANNEVVVNGYGLAKKQAQQATRNYQFNYKVVDEQGNHIPFTNIAVPADQLVTYSRVDGRFGLFSTDSVLKVNFKASGYATQNMALKYNNVGQGVVTLKELPSSNQNLVVIGGADDKKAKSAPKSSKPVSEIQEAEPEDGADNYSSYIANNININEKPQGEVVLSFDISKTGVPTNITVAQSLGSTADQEAIRLLTEGPKWKSKNRKKNKGKLVIKF